MLAIDRVPYIQFIAAFYYAFMGRQNACLYAFTFHLA